MLISKANALSNCCFYSSSAYINLIWSEINTKISISRSSSPLQKVMGMDHIKYYNIRIALPPSCAYNSNFLLNHLNSLRNKIIVRICQDGICPGSLL